MVLLKIILGKCESSYLQLTTIDEMDHLLEKSNPGSELLKRDTFGTVMVTLNTSKIDPFIEKLKKIKNYLFITIIMYFPQLG